LFPSFDEADGVAVEVGFLGEGFLRNASLDAEIPQSLGKEPSRVFGGHAKNVNSETSARLHSTLSHSSLCYYIASWHRTENSQR
jgi:hypothetical protein